ncbi:MAG: hypothetical protein N2117_01175 [Anaerolineales bacterium]|nr:hypothetical protein [Anaerolineales bacterium]MCX7753843.1 hypothetical protein [Anaerolineales bacterium]MDW8276439.1 hypothetical protein [Anaerolineales bacterium]
MEFKRREPQTFIERISKLVDRASEYFAHRKGLLPMLGMLLIFLNLLLTIFLPADMFLVRTNLALHIGLLVAIFGILLAWAL